MRKPRPQGGPFGLIAEFDQPDRLLDGVRRARKAGYRAIDAFSPFPVDGMEEAMGLRENIVPWLTLVGGISGAAAGYGLQLYTNYVYQIEIGGRPLYAWQSFMLITFELTVLFAVLSAIFGMLLLNRLPRLHHPVFDVEGFHLASSDKFFLIVFAQDARFDATKTRRFLRGLDPVRVEWIDHGEPSP